MYNYVTNNSYSEQKVASFQTEKVFNGVDDVDFSVTGKSENYSAIINASITKNDEGDYSIVTNSQLASDESYLAKPTIEYDSILDTIDVYQTQAMIDVDKAINGDFSSGLDNWDYNTNIDATATIVDGKAYIRSDSMYDCYIRQTILANTTYRVEADINYVKGLCYFRVYYGANINIIINSISQTHYSFEFTSGASEVFVEFVARPGGEMYVDNVQIFTSEPSTNNDGEVIWSIDIAPDRTILAPANTICTPEEIYDFCGTENTLRTVAQTQVLNGLIDRVTDEIEQYIGRTVIPVQKTISIHDGRYCDIVGRNIYFNDIYYDIFSITSLYNGDELLQEGVDFVINNPNVIEKIDGYWTTEKLGITIDGYFGMGYEENGSYYPHKALKQIIIEAIAVKSGIWSRIVSDGEGNNFTTSKSNLAPWTRDELKRFVQPVVI